MSRASNAKSKWLLIMDSDKGSAHAPFVLCESFHKSLKLEDGTIKKNVYEKHWFAAWNQFDNKSGDRAIYLQTAAQDQAIHYDEGKAWTEAMLLNAKSHGKELYYATKCIYGPECKKCLDQSA